MGGDGSEFFQVPKLIWGEKLRIFPILKAYIEGRENVYYYELTCWVLKARVWGGRELQGEFGAYMEETEQWHLAPRFAWCFADRL